MSDNAPGVSTSNLVVLRATMTNDPTTRDLAGGACVVQFDVTTQVDDDGHRSNVSVPVAWHNPPVSGLTSLATGTEVVVVGTVRRRFFRSGGQTQSRTEVIADRVVPARRTKTVRSLLASAAVALTG